MPRSRFTPVLAIVLWSLAIISTATAEDWPQWRGPDRTGKSAEKGLLQEWPEGGPTKLWTNSDVGLGYSSFSVVGDTLYTMGARDNQEFLLALNVADGKQRWAIQVGERLENKWGDGPRGTPTIDGEWVYCLGGRGDLICARATDGDIRWHVSMSDFAGKIPNWGYTESVLIDGDKCLCTPGGKQGTMLALNKETGEKIWQSEGVTDGAQYASIIAADHNGGRQYIQLVQKQLFGVSADGKVLWTSDWSGRTAVIPTPIFHDGKVYIASGYGVGCKLVEIKADNEAVDVYENKVMKNHHGGVILLDDHLYGYSDGAGWVCQNFANGEMVWNERGALPKGSLTYADGRFYLLDERNGEAVLIDASAEGWNERGRFTLDPQTEQRSPSGKIWTHPVVANGRLYLRDQELLHCYDVSAKSAGSR